MAATCPEASRWRAHLQGDVPPNDEATLLAHLDTCVHCQQALEQLAEGDAPLRKLARQIGTLPPTQTPNLDLLLAGSSLLTTDTDETTGTEEVLERLQPPTQPGELGRLGPYAVINVLGTGGMGVVLRARDPKLQRELAIKVLAPAAAGTDSASRRFLRGARAAAAVRDEHVVAVHAVDEFDGMACLVMEHISGGSLQERLDAAGPLPPLEVTRVGREIALGLVAAHQQGLIHRDIKPSNLLVDKSGRIKITDFGLARAVEDSSLTRHGVIAGTPQYMAPEQARGDAVDARADLFSLGSVLYALCTGRPPFGTDSPLAILKRINDDAPRPIQKLNPAVPDGLAAIIARLLAKNPAERFQTAAEVAEQLDHEIRSQESAIKSQESRGPARRVRPARRWGLAIAVLFLLVVIPAAFLAGPTVYRFATNQGQLIVETEDPDVEVKAKGPEVTIIDTKTKREVTLKAGKYELELVAGPPGLRLVTTEFTLERGGKEIVRIRLAPGVTAVEKHRFTHQSVYAVAFCRDGRSVLSGGWDHAVRLWDLDSGREVHAFNLRQPGKNHAVYCVAVAPNGCRALAGSRDGRVWLFDLEQRKILQHCDHPRTPESGGFGVNSVAFAPNGRQALLGSFDGVVRLWNIDDWKEVNRFQHAFGLWSVDYSPDGRRALTAAGVKAKNPDLHLSWWDLDTLEQLHRSSALDEGVWRAVFSPDGRWAASASLDHTLRLWNADTGKEVRALLHPDTVHSVCFCPDGRWVVSGGYDGIVRLWEVKTGREVHRYIGHKGTVSSVAVSPDGRLLVTASDNTVRLWDLPQ